MYSDISGETNIMTFMVPAPGPSIAAGLIFIEIQETANAVTPDRIGISIKTFSPNEGVSPRLIPKKFRLND
ncbi:unknown [Clostridium sp. CAG:169]|nr:unknown [Clostridium sp. CAG:169]